MSRRKVIMLGVLLLLSGLVQPGWGNHIQVSNVTLTGLNINSKFIDVECDLSWENGWRDNINWDAAWVFVKYQPVGSGIWHHAWLSTTTSSHTIPSGYTCAVGSTSISDIDRGMGVFVFRSANGSGSNNLTDLRLRWEYGANGLADGALVAIKVIAIEMVYVPQGPFYLGDADQDQVACFYTYGSAEPYHITSETAINIGPVEGYLWADGFIESSTLPSAFPKGYGGFYCMKYEISEGQWVDFFNTLTQAQKQTRDLTNTEQWLGKGGDEVLYRNTIAWSSGDASTMRPDRACNFLSWGDGAAYADWAGLRVMTELEFEKACRGDYYVDDEFAGGTPAGNFLQAINGAENGTESIVPTAPILTNCRYNGAILTGGDGGEGPVRCGIFATASSTREMAGASYYGIMDLSGNVEERTVTVANAAGRAFTGLHGDGLLKNDGHADVAFWPDSTGVGGGYRGGSWDLNIADISVSDRHGAGTASSYRNYGYGFRCVRSSP